MITDKLKNIFTAHLLSGGSEQINNIISLDYLVFNLSLSLSIYLSIYIYIYIHTHRVIKKNVNTIIQAPLWFNFKQFPHPCQHILGISHR